MLEDILETLDKIEIVADDGIIRQLKAIPQVQDSKDIEPDKLTIKSFFFCNKLLVRNTIAPVQPDPSKRIPVSYELKQYLIRIPELKLDNKD